MAAMGERADRFEWEGQGEKRNVVLQVQPKGGSEATHVVVYFPGDVQMEEEDMADSPWRKWALEPTMRRLQDSLPSAFVCAICPARMEGHCGLAEYDHFLTYGETLLHLMALLQHLPPPYQHLPLVLVFFSKGVLVANALFAELAWLAEGNPSSPLPDWDSGLATCRGAMTYDREIARARVVPGPLGQKRLQVDSLLRQIASVHLVDGHRYPTSPAVLRGMDRLLREHPRLRLCVHTSPRQTACPARPYIGVEHRLFLTGVRGLQSYSLFAEDPPTMEMHFRTLDAISLLPS